MKIDEYENISFLASLIAEKIKPLKIYLFGSFAERRNNENSDYDFYIIVPDDDKRNLLDIMTDAQKSMRHKKSRPVDVLVNRRNVFERLKNSPISIENNVAKNGVVVYG